MNILAIETSCDETAAAVVKVSGKNLKAPQFEVLSNIVSSQVKMHAQYGGVVPNLAAREHAKNIVPIIEKTLSESKTDKNNIDLIAVTRGPGLIPALLVGTSAAKALAYTWKKPIVGVNHIEGHIYANFIDNPEIEFPILCLIVSGGHTELVLMRDYRKFELVGKTRDDAVGEAFDKAARLLELGYPGGPAISKAAESGTPGTYSLPRPMISSNDFDFSFSGIKTAVRSLVETQKFASLRDASREKTANNIAAEFQQAVIDVLAYKTYKAAVHFKPKTVILAGGVAANRELREQLQKALLKSQFPNSLRQLADSQFPKEAKDPSLRYAPFRMTMPKLEYCTDNAAMIAAAGYFNREKSTDKPWGVETDANIVIANKP